MIQERGDSWVAYNGDCVEITRQLPSDSVHYSIFSPPFASLYTYSDMPEDMGNCKSHNEFFEHFNYLIIELQRVLKPGRLVSVHCMDLPLVKERDGEIGLVDFPGRIIRAFQDAGFIYHSRVTIWKDPLVAMQRTKAIGLLHKQLCKDSTYSRQGIADYLVTFRNKGDNPEPVAHGTGLNRYIGTDLEPQFEKTDNAATNKYGHFVWQRYASPVWMDIDPTDVLEYEGARDQHDERHICPLQKTVVQRGIELWSNPGDVVLTPFGGVGTEGYIAVQEDRKAILCELKPSYFKQLVMNMTRAQASVQPKLEI